MKTDEIPASQIIPTKCNACRQPLLLENLFMDDGCPCNSRRGVNFTPQHCAECRTDNCVKPGHRIQALWGIGLTSTVAAREEAGWLIEGNGVYWNGRCLKADGFTTNVDQATRFSRREDADVVKHWLLREHAFALRTTEHMWMAATPEGTKTPPTPARQRPSVGRTVHYLSHPNASENEQFNHGQSVTWPAIILAVDPGNEDRVFLRLFGLRGDYREWATFSETPQPGCWSWPPRT